jgi:arginyl-tRNA synthetase
VDAQMSSDGYQGTYLIDLAKEIIAENKDKFLKIPEAEAIKELGQIGLNKMLTRIKVDLEMLRVNFDVWYRELSLYENGLYDKVMDMLRQGGFIT